MRTILFQKPKRPERIKKTLDIPSYYTKRNKILVLRRVGGLGDILMHRMLFEDIKLLAPDFEIHFACPALYHPAVIDHPYLDQILDSRQIEPLEYLVHYNTSTACGRYEMRLAPYSGDHRSDIWAAHCGLTLTSHNMHIQLTQDEKRRGKALIEEVRENSGPVVLVSPVSAIPAKDLLPHQLSGLIEGLRARGLCPIGLHKNPVPDLEAIICGTSIREWMAVIDQTDYVVSVDTATFHCAGGLGKPVVGVFSFADGLVYGKYYPKFELVQFHRSTHPDWQCGPCYNWGNCPKSKQRLKPCITELTPEMILTGVDNMLQKWPSKE